MTARYGPCMHTYTHPCTTQWGFRGTRTSGMMARWKWLRPISYSIDSLHCTLRTTTCSSVSVLDILDMVCGYPHTLHIVHTLRGHTR